MNILWLGVIMIILGGIITAILNRKKYEENAINLVFATYHHSSAMYIFLFLA